MKALYTSALIAILLLSLPIIAGAQHASPVLKRPARSTARAITAADLRTRLSIFADDSMMGRQTGEVGNDKATAYLATEMRRLGLRPGGDHGTFFQTIPFARIVFDTTSVLHVEGTQLIFGKDYLLWWGLGRFVPVATRIAFDDVPVIHGGILGDTIHRISAEAAAGKLVLLTVPPGLPFGDAQFWQVFNAHLQRGLRSDRLGAARAIAVVIPDSVTAQWTRSQGSWAWTWAVRDPNTPSPSALVLNVTRQAAATMLGAPLDGAAPGTVGKTLRGSFRFRDIPMPSRNVVAVLPGADRVLRHQYVALGAHSDAFGGLTPAPVDHDSVRAFNTELARRRLAEGKPGDPQMSTAAERASIRVNVDSLRRLRPPRPDSVRNGADDNGSGSVALLEIAEAFATATVRPKRSLLFVWHTGEEQGLFGSMWFTDHPTIPRNSIVTHINFDMIGRGGDDDISGGGPNLLFIVGPRRLSTELATLVETVNARQPTPLALDYSWDTPTHPERIYCRGDHYPYARYGIPVAFFFTGTHRDYHQVTDEAQYIDYEHMTRITRLAHHLTAAVANAAHRPRVDQPKPDPTGVCAQ